jgi:hypothetical protein
MFDTVPTFGAARAAPNGSSSLETHEAEQMAVELAVSRHKPQRAPPQWQ